MAVHRVIERGMVEQTVQHSAAIFNLCLHFLSHKTFDSFKPFFPLSFPFYKNLKPALRRGASC